MDSSLLQFLQRSRSRIKARWVALLHSKLVNTPMADPEILERLFGSTLDEVFRRVRANDGTQPFAPIRTHKTIRDSCACGDNPLLEYYPSCELAMLVVSMEFEGPADEQNETVASEIRTVIRTLAARDVASFCSLCQRRQPAGAVAAAPGGQGKLEYFPMTPGMADSWLASAYQQSQPASPAAHPKRGRYGPDE